MTYVALVPFVMRHTRLGTVLPLPYFGTFAGTNVRLYSVDDAGRHGVVFLSLETQRLAVVPVTRIGLGVPYAWAKMSVARAGPRISYAGIGFAGPRLRVLFTPGVHTRFGRPARVA